MMRSDEERDFITDSIDKKRIARGAHNRRTHAGKGGAVKFPMDYLTKKEREAMNGEVSTYNLSKPMTWAEFKKMPEDLQKQYILQLRERFGVSDAKIAAMLGISAWTLGQKILELGIGKGRKAKWLEFNAVAWAEICGNSEKEGGAEMGKEEKATIAENTPAPCKGEAKSIVQPLAVVVPQSGSLIFEGKANDALRTIQHLLMNENVRLSVMWEKLEGEVGEDGD